MLAVIKAPPATRTALQRISRCKRRRASSHNPKRLPKSVRTMISKEAEKNVKKSKKGNERKIGEIANVSGEKVNRLESHKWHAKRFHMIIQENFKSVYVPSLAVKK